MKSKRQQTMAKIKREQAVKERRARKQEKRHAAAAARTGEVAELRSETNTSEDNASSD